MTNKYYISLRGRMIIINLNQSNKNHNILRTGGIFHIIENDGYTMNFIKMRRVIKNMNIFRLLPKEFYKIELKKMMDLDYNK